MDSPSFIRRHWRWGLLGLLFIPGMAFQNMQARKAAALNVMEADDQVKGLKLKFSKSADTITYQNGVEMPLDGFGYAVLTADDYAANPDRFKRVGFNPKPEDFPIVVFFNLTGFEPSGDPGVVRRARDGSVVFELSGRPTRMVAAMSPNRDGTFRVTFRDGTTDTVAADDWYRTYMGVEPAPKIPSPEQLDKMTDAELKKLGMNRMTKEEYQKKYGGDVPVPPATPNAKTGVKGVVIQVGGIPAIKPLAGVTVYALTGAVDPVASVSSDTRVVAKAVTDASGGYVLTVPDGVYTIVAEIGGKPRGNAINPKRWPSVKVGGEWVEYEFRVPPG